MNGPHIVSMTETPPETPWVYHVFGKNGVVMSSTGPEPGTGDVTLRLEELPLVSGKWFSRVLVDIHGRVVDGVEGQEPDFNPADFIQNQNAVVQNAIFNVGGGIVGSLVVTQSITLPGPLSIAQGGTGLNTTQAGYVFVGPISGSGAPSWRRLQGSDLPFDSNNYIQSNPVTTQTASFNISGSGRVGSLFLTGAADGILTIVNEELVSGSISTSVVPEGTNLYYTQARARASVSGSPGRIAYNSSTGVFDLALGVVTPGISTKTEFDAYGRAVAFHVATTLAAYGITDAYTKLQTDARITELVTPLVNAAVAAYLSTLLGQPNGIATLGPTGIVPDSQLPTSSGSGGDLQYIHNQPTAALVWTIVHNMGTLPKVSCVDTYELPFVDFEGDITYVDVNSLTIEFKEPSRGIAVCR